MYAGQSNRRSRGHHDQVDRDRSHQLSIHKKCSHNMKLNYVMKNTGSYPQSSSIMLIIGVHGLYGYVRIMSES